MAPTIVTRDSRPVIAVGGAGGRKIPNGILDFLTQHLYYGKTCNESLAAPRMNTEGGLNLTLENSWPAADADYLKRAGYRVKTGPGAIISAVSFDHKSGGFWSGYR